MSIRSKIEEKAEDYHSPILAEAQNRFVHQVMEWESCGYDEAYAICVGWTDPVEHEYTLGYKLADPFWQLGMFKQRGKKSRAKAVENFRKTLTPEEDLLFLKELENHMGEKFREEYRDKTEPEEGSTTYDAHGNPSGTYHRNWKRKWKP